MFKVEVHTVSAIKSEKETVVSLLLSAFHVFWPWLYVLSFKSKSTLKFSIIVIHCISFSFYGCNVFGSKFQLLFVLPLYQHMYIDTKLIWNCWKKVLCLTILLVAKSLCKYFGLFINIRNLLRSNRENWSFVNGYYSFGLKICKFTYNNEAPFLGNFCTAWKGIVFKHF